MNVRCDSSFFPGCSRWDENCVEKLKDCILLRKYSHAPIYNLPPTSLILQRVSFESEIWDPRLLCKVFQRWTNNLLFLYHIKLLCKRKCILQDINYSMLTLLMLLAMYGSWGTRITSISLIQWLAAVITISRGRGSRVLLYSNILIQYGFQISLFTPIL